MLEFQRLRVSLKFLLSYSPGGGEFCICRFLPFCTALSYIMCKSRLAKYIFLHEIGKMIGIFAILCIPRPAPCQTPSIPPPARPPAPRPKSAEPPAVRRARAVPQVSRTTARKARKPPRAAPQVSRTTAALPPANRNPPLPHRKYYAKM